MRRRQIYAATEKKVPRDPWGVAVTEQKIVKAHYAGPEHTFELAPVVLPDVVATEPGAVPDRSPPPVSKTLRLKKNG